MKLDGRKERPDVIEGEEVKKSWDVKKIAVGLVFLALLFIVGSYLFIPRNSGVKDESGQGTLGITSSSEEEVPPLPSTEDIENILIDAQESLSNITSENLTSSQAAIQKVITDLQKLQEANGPGEIFCDLVCKK